MNEIDTKNNEIISAFVKKHWPFKEKSHTLFEKRIKTLETDEFYLNLLKEKQSLDGRIRYTIPDDKMKFFDKGWDKFQTCFSPFIEYFDVKYINFRTNKIAIKKNEVKLRKAIILYYSTISTYQGSRICGIDNGSIFQNEKNEETKNYQMKKLERKVDAYLDDIGTKSFPKNKSLELVISLNFADWFMCSTGQQWTSCLSLNSTYSYAYWAGLPGLIVDPNRSMLYITDGTKKKEYGIEVDNVISRTWLLLNENNNLGTVVWYPQEFVSNNFLENITGLKFVSYEDGIGSKNPINEMLYYKNEKSCFIYQDNYYIHNDMFQRPGGSGHYYRKDNEKGSFTQEDVFDYTGSMAGLIEGDKLQHFYADERGSYCSHCDEFISEGDENYINDEPYCETCYNELAISCFECGSTHHIDDNHEFEGKDYCEDCFNDVIIECSQCGNLVHINNVIEIDEENFCSEACITEWGYHTCHTCGEYVIDNEAIEFEDVYYCETCSEDIITECETCETYHKKENVIFIEESDENICKYCLQKEIDKNQIFFNFEAA